MKSKEELGLKIAVNDRHKDLEGIKENLLTKLRTGEIELELNKEMLIVIEKMITKEKETIK